MSPLLLATFVCLAVAGANPAQSTEKITVTVVVTDVTGALIPGASVSISSPDIHLHTVSANARGEALFDLIPGTFQLSVIAPGFNRTVKVVVLHQVLAQRVTAVLRVAPSFSPIVMPNPSSELTEHEEIQVALPYDSIEILTTIPTRKLGTHHRLFRRSDQNRIDHATTN